MAGQVTLSDVAREAGVSLATASRALNGSANRTVGEDLRKRVHAAAARLRYSPDGIAQAMARGRTTSLGLVLPDIADPAAAAIASGVADAADAAGLVVVLAPTGRRPERVAQVVGLMERQRARGVVLLGGPTGLPEADDVVHAALVSFRGVGGAVSMVGRAADGFSGVVLDDHAGARDLVRALHGRGYRRFALLAGTPHDPISTERRAGFLEELAAVGCPVPEHRVLVEDRTRDGGHAAMRRLIADGGAADVDVVLTTGDVMAAGALAAAHDAGLRVPEDLALAGFDDLALLRDVPPGLTSVRLPLADIGREAVRLALLPVAGEPEHVRVAGEVVLRGSTPGHAPR